MAHRLEHILQVFFRHHLAKAGNVDLAVVRIAVCAFLLALGVGDVHGHLVAVVHVSPVELQGVFGGRLTQKLAHEYEKKGEERTGEVYCT